MLRFIAKMMAESTTSIFGPRWPLIVGALLVLALAGSGSFGKENGTTIATKTTTTTTTTSKPTATAAAKDEDKDKGEKVVCKDLPKKCCYKLDWAKVLLEPDEFERTSGCKLKCCEMLAQRQSRKSLSRQRDNIITSLISCITELLLNVSNFSFQIPKVCCRIPLIEFFPVCSSASADGKRSRKGNARNFFLDLTGAAALNTASSGSLHVGA